MKKEEFMTEAVTDLKQEIMNEVYNLVDDNDVANEKENQMKETIREHEVSIDLGGERRKAAFARGLNRGVSEKSIAELAERMKAKGYRRAEVISVMRAEEAVEADSKMVLMDLSGCPIAAVDAHEYYLVIDGAKRVRSAQKVNGELAEDKQIVVPAVEIELAEGETIAQYIYETNSTKEEWSTADYAQSALQAQENPLLERYAALMKSKSNPEGLTLTVLNRMYCANEKALSGADFRALCEGRTTKGRKQREVIPAYNLERGNDILEACREMGLAGKELNRRFVMDVFEELELKYDRKIALETFALAGKTDIEAMRSKRGRLDGEKFTTYMRNLAEEVKAIDGAA